MTQEEKAKAYDKALERAKVVNPGTTDYNIVTELFPELKESEDERIRKWLIGVIKSNEYGNISNVGEMPCPKPNVIAWLGKQGQLIKEHEDELNKCARDNFNKGMNEVLGGYDCTSVDLSKFCDEIQEFSDMLEDKPKPYWDGWYEAMEWIRTHGNPFEKQDEQKLTDKVEPKFKVGNKIKLAKGPKYPVREIIAVKNNAYYFDELVHFPFSHQDEWELVEQDEKGTADNIEPWTIQNAKDGDVLSNGNIVLIFKCFEEPSYRQRIIAYIGLDSCGQIQVTNECWNLGLDSARPATKEQCELLFTKMKEAGYEWDAEKKKLKKINQNPTWSEEDEERYVSCLQRLGTGNLKQPETINTVWLKSLKERMKGE